MSDFESLYAEGEATDYAANAEPVPQEEVNAIHENLTQAMGDSVLNGQTENLGAEMVGDMSISQLSSPSHGHLFNWWASTNFPRPITIA